MAIDNKLLKGFANFKGLDLRSSDLERSSEYATDINNVDYRKTGAMTKRKGYQGKFRNFGGAGTSTYAELNTTTGAITEKIVTVEDSLYVEVEENLTITYSGPDSARADLYYSNDGSSFYLDLYDNNVLVIHRLLGNVVEEASFTSISDVVTDVTALTNFTAVGSGNTGEPAAFSTIQRDLEISSTGTNIPYQALVSTTLPTNAPAPFNLAQAAKSNIDFENASFANMKGVLYIATGYDNLYKYDGTRLYLAGLPKPATTPTTAFVVGSVTDTRKYIYTYEYTDAKGNIIESIPSEATANISPVAQDTQVTVSNIQDTTGFDTDSTDLKINLYSTTSSGNTFYLIKSVVNDGTTATQVIVDNETSPLAFPEYIVPIKDHGGPPVGKYLAVHQGILFVGGISGEVSTVYYSDIDSPEYFPTTGNSFNVDTSVGDKVSGIAPLGNSFFVFKDKTIHQITGNINEDSFRVDLFGNGTIGCAAHATIQEVNGFLFFLSDKGVYALSQNNNELAEVSDIIEGKFTAYNRPFNKKKAVAVNWISEDKYLIFMPSETSDYANSNSAVFVYDHYRKAWLEWDNINALGGLSLKDGDLYFTERRNSVLNSQTEYYTYKFLNSGDSFDYADHNQAISFTYKGNWESLGEPSLFKKFLRCKIHSLDASLDDFESDDFTLSLKTEINFISVTSSAVTLDFSGGAAGGWGLDPWGSAPWGATRLEGKLTKLKPAKARSLRLILENDNIHENVLISGYEYEIAIPYKPFIKE